jgi:SH3 domain-containing protein
MAQRHAAVQRFSVARGWRVAVAFGAMIAVASCAKMPQSVGRWFGAATPTPAPTPETAAGVAAQGPRVYYAGVAGLTVYSEPSASSKVVGSLALHEKVTRSRLDHGYAYVESAKGGVKGWVSNAQLIWRLPAAPTTAAPASGEAQPEAPVAPAAEQPEEPVAPEATSTAVEPQPTATPEPAVSRSPKPTPRGVAPSIFNPY